MITENVKRKVSVVGTDLKAIKKLFLEELHEEASSANGALICCHTGPKFVGCAVLLCCCVSLLGITRGLEADHAQLH